ncbi:MAG: MarR family transcriptional regulator [Victivallales bacterium]|nr:MarR family transcriptional regulator [Victivallales bacterium]
METGNKCDKVLRILRKIMQAVDIHSRKLFKKYGMTVPQMLLLKEICRSKKPMSSAEVAKAMSLTPATIVPIVNKLIKNGYIKRRRSLEDKRLLELLPTEKAITFYKEAPLLMHEDFVNRFVSLENWEQKMLLSSLERIETMLKVDGTDALPVLDNNPSGEALKIVKQLSGEDVLIK